MGSGQEQLQFVRVSSSRTYLNSVYWCLIGSWYVKFARCLLPFSLVINCGNLQNPLFGKVVLTGTTFGSSATYSCQRGYILVGGSTRTCQDNGQWSGVAPVCRSKQLSTSVIYLDVLVPGIGLYQIWSINLLWTPNSSVILQLDTVWCMF